MSPVIKFLLYFPKHWRSCIWSQNPLPVQEQLLPWAWVCLQSLFQGVSGEVGSTREPQSKWQWVMCCFAPAASLSWETSPLFTRGMGYSSEEGRAVNVWSFSLLGFLWCIEPFAGHPVAAGLARVGVIPPFRRNKPWGVRQRKCDPDIAEQKSALKAYPQFSKPEDTSEAMSKYAAGKNYIKPETQKLILKSFLYFPEQFALK